MHKVLKLFFEPTSGLNSIYSIYFIRYLSPNINVQSVFVFRDSQ